MNKYDVLKRAKSIIEKAPLTTEQSDHGEYCPYCTIATAKSQLDEEQDDKLDLLKIVAQTIEMEFELATDIRIMPSDAPLLDAKGLLGEIPLPFTKKKTLNILNNAIQQEGK